MVPLQFMELGIIRPLLGYIGDEQLPSRYIGM